MAGIAAGGSSSTTTAAAAEARHHEHRRPRRARRERRHLRGGPRGFGRVDALRAVNEDVMVYDKAIRTGLLDLRRHLRSRTASNKVLRGSWSWTTPGGAAHLQGALRRLHRRSGVTISAPSSATVPKGGKATIKVTATVDLGPDEEDPRPLGGCDPAGRGASVPATEVGPPGAERERQGHAPAHVDRAEAVRGHARGQTPSWTSGQEQHEQRLPGRHRPGPGRLEVGRGRLRSRALPSPLGWQRHRPCRWHLPVRGPAVRGNATPISQLKARRVMWPRTASSTCISSWGNASTIKPRGGGDPHRHLR
ncbi:hypothetical protein QJS66_16395 [Kocuria rhizophila]|nr:hypothetical protein QJS66_16395 [Kocuria rhizophila]